MDTLYIIIDILIILFIFLMIIYLAFDRSSFQLDQQFRGLKKIIMEAAAEAGENCYEKISAAKTTYKKIKVLSEFCENPAFEDLHMYFDIHNDLAYKHNEKIQKSVFRGIAKIMGFKEYPMMRYSDEIILTSRKDNRRTRL